MFTNKVVLITGASAGIGAETALDFSRQGANLVITGRNQENLKKVAKECEEASPTKSKPLALVSDVNKESDNLNQIKATVEHWKKLDVLVNNAGILGASSIESTSLEQYDQIMNTNVRSVYHLTILATHLIQTKGNVINLSSIAGLRSLPNLLAYCMSKAAIDQFTRCVALELAPKGVRVNAINPGTIVTDIFLKGTMNEKEFEVYLERCKATHAIGRPGYVNEVSATVIFLASDNASNITGVSLPVDGGRHAMCPR